MSDNAQRGKPRKDPAGRKARGSAEMTAMVLRTDRSIGLQDFGRTIFVNTGGSRGGRHDISPSKRQRSSSPARRAARMLLGSWWRMVAVGVICPKAEDRPRQSF
jgi:hypothetical protein